jgi:putative hydrolase of the HAD superfamily
MIVFGNFISVKMKYKHIFFDLDRTLWDFEANSSDTLAEIFAEHSLNLKCKTFEFFLENYKELNKQYWIDYRNNRVSKEVLSWKRFYDALLLCGIDDVALSKQIAKEYVGRSPYKTKLFPEVKNTLEKLKSDFHLHIITNGFKEVQFIKLKQSGLDIYPKSITISEDVGKPKPHIEFFESALKKANANAYNSLIVGDDLETDILGAKNYGIDYVWFNPEKEITKTEIKKQINCIDELIDIVYHTL